MFTINGKKLYRKYNLYCIEKSIKYYIFSSNKPYYKHKKINLQYIVFFHNSFYIVHLDMSLLAKIYHYN